MRLASLALLPMLALASFARADVFPVGGYVLEAQPGTGIHLSTGTLSGYIDFNASQQITSVDIIYTDASSLLSYSFTNPGATSYDSHDHLLGATITNASNPAEYYYFSVETSAAPGGIFTLTCGVDCDSFVSVPGAVNSYEEFAGTIDPTPEPSSLVLLGTGALGAAIAVRRRLAHRKP